MDFAGIRLERPPVRLEAEDTGDTLGTHAASRANVLAVWSAGRQLSAESTRTQSNVREKLRALHESEQISEALYRRALSTVIPLLSGRLRSPSVTADDQEDEVSFLWMFAGRRAEISIPDVGRIYVNVDRAGQQAGIEGFFSVLPTLAVGERLAALESWSRR